MEPTLHCAGAGLGCTLALLRPGAREPLHLPLHAIRSGATSSSSRRRREPRKDCGAGGTFVKRIIGLPGETWEMRNGFVYINGKRLNEPYVKPDRRDVDTQAAGEDSQLASTS